MDNVGQPPLPVKAAFNREGLPVQVGVGEHGIVIGGERPQVLDLPQVGTGNPVGKSNGKIAQRKSLLLHVVLIQETQQPTAANQRMQDHVAQMVLRLRVEIETQYFSKRHG